MRARGEHGSNRSTTLSSFASPWRRSRRRRSSAARRDSGMPWPAPRSACSSSACGRALRLRWRPPDHLGGRPALRPSGVSAVRPGTRLLQDGSDPSSRSSSSCSGRAARGAAASEQVLLQSVQDVAGAEPQHLAARSGRCARSPEREAYPAAAGESQVRSLLPKVRLLAPPVDAPAPLDLTHEEGGPVLALGHDIDLDGRAVETRPPPARGLPPRLPPVACLASRPRSPADRELASHVRPGAPALG
jgi:hypothetical protein